MKVLQTYKFAFLPLFALLAARQAGGQVIDWAMLLGGEGNEVGYSVATDFDGNVVVAGSFEGAASIGGKQLSSAGYSDVFVAKFSADGAPIWVERLGGVATDQPAQVAIDRETGDVVVAGQFATMATVRDQVLQSSGFTDVFVARFSKSGALQWALAFGSPTADVAAGVAVDPNGDSLVAGQFSGTFACGPTTLTSAGANDIFVANVASNGTVRWCRGYGGSLDDEVDGIAVSDAGLLALTGAFGTATDLGGGNLASAGSFDAYVATYIVSNGDYHWARVLGGSGYDAGQAVTFDPVGAVLVTGYFGLFDGSVDFGGGVLATRGGADAFVAKYNGSDGQYLWASTFGGGLDDYGNAVSVSQAGEVTIAGEFQGSASFAGVAASAGGQFDAFLAEFSSSGAPLWWRSYGDIINDKAYGVAVDFEGNYFVTGFSVFRIDLGQGDLYSAGMSDAFLAKLAPPVVRTPTPMPTLTPTRLPSTPTFTPTPIPSTPTFTLTFTPTRFPPTPTRTFTPPTSIILTMTPTVAARGCAVDCNNDGTVTVDELLVGINIVLGHTALDTCDVSDANDDGTVTIHEVVSAVKSALTECP